MAKHYYDSLEEAEAYIIHGNWEERNKALITFAEEKSKDLAFYWEIFLSDEDPRVKRAALYHACYECYRTKKLKKLMEILEFVYDKGRGNEHLIKCVSSTLLDYYKRHGFNGDKMNKTRQLCPKCRGHTKKVHVREQQGGKDEKIHIGYYCSTCKEFFKK